MSSATRDPNRPREEWQCQYRGVFCQSRRSMKKNGSLHSLCEEHRRRANENQRRFQIRQQNLKKRSRQPRLPDLQRRGTRSLAGHAVDPECQDVIGVLTGNDFGSPVHHIHWPESELKDTDLIFTPLSMCTQLGDSTPSPAGGGQIDDEFVWLAHLDTLLASSD